MIINPWSYCYESNLTCFTAAINPKCTTVFKHPLYISIQLLVKKRCAVMPLRYVASLALIVAMEPDRQPPQP